MLENSSELIKNALKIKLLQSKFRDMERLLNITILVCAFLSTCLALPVYWLRKPSVSIDSAAIQDGTFEDNKQGT